MTSTLITPWLCRCCVAAVSFLHSWCRCTVWIVRCQDCVSTHDQQMLEATPCLRLSELESSWRDYDVIGIDEGQFFPDLIPFCEAAANAGKTVLVAALDSTFQRLVSTVMQAQAWRCCWPLAGSCGTAHLCCVVLCLCVCVPVLCCAVDVWMCRASQPFHNVCDLVPLAESVTKLSAICQLCQQEAAYSKRLTDDTSDIVIGGAEAYVPTCRACYFDEPASMSLLSASGASGGGSGSGSDSDGEAPVLAALDVSVDVE